MKLCKWKISNELLNLNLSREISPLFKYVLKKEIVLSVKL